MEALRQKGSFAQNLAITFSGSAAVTALGFLLTPVMSRIYPPAAYGEFATFSAIIGNLNLLTTLCYTNAIPLPATKEKAYALVQLIFVLSIAVTAAICLAFAVAGHWLMVQLKVDGLGLWFYTIPLILLLFNLNMLMNSWYTRTKAFRTRAGVDVATTLVGRGVTIGYGWFTHGHPAGLVIGDVINKLTAFVAMLRSGIHREIGELRRTFSWAQVKAAALEFREFPLYQLPAAYVSILSAQLPIFALTSGFGAAAAGFYSFSVSLLEIPINLIGSAVAPVFYQKASETYATEPERLPDITRNLYFKLLYLGLLPFGAITVFGDWIFHFVFGARWAPAGVYTAYLGYYYIFKLTSQSTGSLYTIMGKQRYLLLTNVLLLVVRAGGLGLGLFLHDVNLALMLFGVGSLVVTFFTDLHILSLLRLPVLRIGAISVALIGCTLLLLWGVRLGLVHWFPTLFSI